MNKTILLNDDSDIMTFENYTYNTALIGISNDNRAIYDYNKMIEFLIKNEIVENYLDANEWLESNTIKSLTYMGENAPIIMYSI